MNIRRIIKDNDELGKSDFFLKPPPPTRRQKQLVVLLIGFFLLIALLADLWPLKNTYFNWNKVGVRAHATLLVNQLDPAMRYVEGGSPDADHSLYYLLAVKFFSIFIHSRLLCLRVLSIVATAISLFFLYRTATILFSRPIALITLFIMVTSPIFIESMRSFGYIPLTQLVVAAALYLLVKTFNDRYIVLKMAFFAILSYVTFGLYQVGRLILFLPVIFFGLRMKHDWYKLVVFIVCIIIIFIFSDLILNDTGFDFYNNFITVGGDELLTGEDESFSDYIQGRLLHQMKYNLQATARYLLNYKRGPFREQNVESQLFSVFYTPFLLLGFVVCLIRRKRSNLFLLFLFFLFFVVLMLTDQMVPRRIIFALYPLYLLIALGLWTVFKAFYSGGFKRKYQRIVVCASAVFLLLVGGEDIREFIFSVARPEYGYSRERLKKIADFIIEKGKEVDSVKYNPSAGDLIWGNPYLSNHPDIMAIFFKIKRDQANIGRIHFRLKEAAGTERSLLYLYMVPEEIDEQLEIPPRLPEWLIGWATDNWGERFVSSAVEGTELNYILLKKIPAPTRSVDEVHARSRNLLQGNGVLLSARSYWWPYSVHNLIDDEENSFWKVVKCRVDKPTWVVADLGEGRAGVVRALAARPRRDHPEWFFRHAKLMGSMDGKSWERVGDVEQREAPRSNAWRRWDFENPRAYRYYRLMIYDGFAGESERFLSMAELALYK